MVLLSNKNYNKYNFSLELISTINSLLAEITKITSDIVRKNEYKNNFNEIVQKFDLEGDLEKFKSFHDEFFEIPEREKDLMKLYLEKDGKKNNLYFQINISFVKLNIKSLRENFPEMIFYFFTICKILNGEFVKTKNILFDFDLDNFEHLFSVDLNDLDYLNNHLVDILFLIWNLDFQKALVELLLNNFSIKSHNEKNVHNLLHIKATQELLEDRDNFII